MLQKHQLELLSPARDAQIAKQAILHGADAVYIGGPGFGARHNASNSLADIAELVEFAHLYHAKVFVTINTILHDDELEGARLLIHKLYEIGVDAIIVQDMGVMEMDLPPIEIHASTQCDIRLLEKAQFLDQAGFSQLVLARELTIPQIKQIADSVAAPIEFFIHGALCVAFSGNCYISHADNGRSANRGDCSQACRLPYTLKDEKGRVVAFDQHLLSMKDNNQTDNLLALVDAGVRSFKIEGRYKDMGYVKNITAHYRQHLDQILAQRPDLAPASSGKTEHFFTPNPDKNFHRGHTDYFANGRILDIGAFESPKFVGLQVGEILGVDKKGITVQTTETINNGDGLNTLYKREVVGFRANTAQLLAEFEQDGQANYQYRLLLNEVPDELSKIILPAKLNRNLDHDWQQALTRKSAERKIAVDWLIETQQNSLKISATSEENISVELEINEEFSPAKDSAKTTEQLEASFSKLGETIYYANKIEIKTHDNQAWFCPVSKLNQLRREAIELLTAKRLALRPVGKRKPISNPPPVYPETELSYLANVYNQKARDFYHKFGVQLIDAAYEAHEETGEVPVMVTKHCLRFAFNLCPKQIRKELNMSGNAKPMQLIHQDEVITLKFDCKPCEMQVMGSLKPHIFKSPQPGSAASGQVFISVEDITRS